MRAAASVLPVRRSAAAWLVAGLIALGSFLYLFSDGLAFIAREWEQPEYSHGWLIPLISAVLLWYRRHAIRNQIDKGSLAGTALVVVALVLFVLTDMAFVRRGPFLLAVPLLGGLGLAAFGARAMRPAWAPLLFLYFAFPLPGSVYVPLSTSLQMISSNLGAGMLRMVGISVFLDGNIIDLGGYMLQVAEACSGLRYLFPLSCFAFLCAWLYKAPLWARALVFLASVPITILTNSARIALTGVFIEYGSQELAEGFMHLFEGWVIFIVALLLLFLLMWGLKAAMRQGGGPLDMLDFDRMAGGQRAMAIAARPPLHAALPAVPASLMACLALLVGVCIAHAPLTQRTQIIPVRPGLVTFPMQLGPWHGTPIAITDEAILRNLGADDYLLADYTKAAVSETADPLSTSGGSAARLSVPVNFWVAYYNEQLDDAGIHSPKDCLPGGGWEYASLEQVDAPAIPGLGGFKLNRGIIYKGNEQMVFYYWLDVRGRKLTDETLLKLYNLWDSFRLGRSDGALVRLMTPVLPGEKVGDAEARLRDFFKASYPTLLPQIDK